MVLIARSRVAKALCDPLTVVRLSEETPAPTVAVDTTAVTDIFTAERPVVPPRVMPAEPLVDKLSVDV